MTTRRDSPRPIRPIQRVTYNAEEAAAALGMSTDSFERHVKDELAFVPVGSLKLYPHRELELWVDRHKINGGRRPK